MKHIIYFIFIVISISMMSCNNDDDRNPEPQMGFFPSTIAFTEISGAAVEIDFTYDSNNRISSIISIFAHFEFKYNSNGLIDEMIDYNTTGNTLYSITYDGDILTSITNHVTNQVLPVAYSNGTYTLNSVVFSLNEQHMVTEYFGGVITYLNNPGPFANLKFQPMLLFIDSFPYTTYLFSAHEIATIELDQAGHNYTFTTVRDANNNIILAESVDDSGSEGIDYAITYELRQLTN